MDAARRLALAARRRLGTGPVERDAVEVDPAVDAIPLTPEPEDRAGPGARVEADLQESLQVCTRWNTMGMTVRRPPMVRGVMPFPTSFIVLCLHLRRVMSSASVPATT